MKANKKSDYFQLNNGNSLTICPPKHFERDEWLDSGGGIGIWKESKPLRDIPIKELEKNIEGNENYLGSIAKNKNQAYCFSTYICRLAFFQRISLPLECTLKKMHPSLNKYPLETTPNFQAFDELINIHHSTIFDKFEENKERKNKNVTLMAGILLKLWIAGYGILPGFGRYTIDNKVIETVFAYSKTWVGKERPVRMLAKLLNQVSESPVNKPNTDKRYSNIINIYDLEKRNWNILLKKYPNNEVLISLYTFAFGELWNRTQGQLIRSFHDPVNYFLKNEALSPLKPVSWYKHSKSLAKYFTSYGFECTISEILTENVFHLHLSTMRQNMSASYITPFVQWIDWLIKMNCLDVNIDKLIPNNRKRRRNITHGKILNPENVSELINHLIDIPVNFLDEGSIRDYRCRRLCLILLSSGARLTQALCLKYDCVQPDKFGNNQLIFHKVKANKPYSILCDDELLSWIEDLKKFAPEKPLFLSDSDSRLVGDNLEARRIFANDTNDGPLTVSAVQNWLKKFQKKIWGNNDQRKDNFFSPHDLRRMQATYLAICGFPKEAIQLKLGHTNINSQIPYTATGNPLITAGFASILEDDIYNLDQSSENEDIKVSKEPDKNSLIYSISNAENDWRHVLSSIIDMTRDLSITSGNDLFAPTLCTTGNPLFLANCGSPGHYNCGSSPIYCLSCIEHRADAKKMIDYKALILREMINCLHHEYLYKRHKATGYRDAYYEKVDGENGLKSNIKKATENLFINSFNFSSNEEKSISSTLWKLAKIWYRNYSKDERRTMLSQKEAISILSSEEI